jgi:acetyl-CoA acetyltransferase
MTDIWERRSIISGLGISRIGRKTGIGGVNLTEESSRAAIADAGLTPADIDGMATMGETPLDQAQAALGLEDGWRGGGMGVGGLLAPVMTACRAVAEGQARHVLVYRTVEMMGGSILPPAGAARTPPPPPPPPPPSSSPEPSGPSPADAFGMSDLLTYHAYAATNWLSMHALRHMHLYGTTKEQLGWLAVNSRRNAAFNPRAVFRDPMTLDDYMAARMISDPFGLLDCDIPIDGSIAFIVSNADYANDCPKPPVRVNALGGVQGGALGAGGWIYRSDYPKMASVEAAADMWNRTDLRPTDIDLAELYDGFTFLTFAWLEALGICADGEAGPFVEGGKRIALDGELPLNTYGGQLSAGRMHGNWVLHEACTQLRGEAGDRQVARHEVAVVSNGGGPIAGCMLLTR